jgi:hypothetical protein
MTGFLPKRSRSQEELVLQTYGEGNRWWMVGDNGVTQPIFNGGGGGVQWCFGSKVGFGGGGVGGGSSSKRRINAGGLGKADQRWRFARWW